MGPFGETWEINEPGLRIHPWFTTASGNCVFAVNEMLVRGTVPETWKDYAFRLPDGKGRWIDCEVKDGRRVRFHRTGISRVGLLPRNKGFEIIPSIERAGLPFNRKRGDTWEQL